MLTSAAALVMLRITLCTCLHRPSPVLTLVGTSTRLIVDTDRAGRTYALRCSAQ